MPRKRARTVEEDGCAIKVVHLERVRSAQRELIGDTELKRLAWIFEVLSDPTRLRIALALLGGEMCVCDLAAAVQMSESAVSHQLRRLRDRALVKRRREGPLHYYSLDDEHVVALIQLGLQHVRE